MKYDKIGAIIQARMGSSRLPGKVLKKLDDNETVLSLLIKRVKLSKLVQKVIIATSYDKKDAIIVEIAKLHNINYFKGSENNVLARYYKAAKKFKLNNIIRITADCPFVDPKMMDNMIDYYNKNNYDYIYNVAEELSSIPTGLDIEILSFKTLKRIYKLAKIDKDKEHVTSFINHHPEIFSIFYYNDERLKKIENLRLTVDFPEDLELCREIYKKLTDVGKAIDFSILDIYDIVEKHPEIMNINKHIPNKPMLF